MRFILHQGITRVMSSFASVKPIVLCGPSGSGKSTLVDLLLKDFPGKFGFSVSHTTRNPRPKEEHGVHYYFVSKEEMENDVAAGKFLESATFSGNMYGTSKEAVEKVCQEGKICILDIDVQGVKEVKKSDLSPWYVFIKPPSMDELEKRLRQRKTETEDSLKKRLEACAKEIEYGGTPGNFDVIIVNDNLEHAYQQLKNFIVSKIFKNECSN